MTPREGDSSQAWAILHSRWDIGVAVSCAGPVCRDKTQNSKF
jgi:hypothetical protein